MADSVAARRKAIPLSIALRVLDAASDVRLSAIAIRTLAHLARHADENGNVGSDEHGRPLANPMNVAPAVEIGNSTAYKAFSLLESCGYLRWERDQGAKRSDIKPGRLRIVLPEHADA
jgi:hypothetical protein